MAETQALSATQKSIIPIAAFTANGDLTNLKPALARGLDAGLTVNEITEILVQLYAYAGFPRSLNGINTLMAVLCSPDASFVIGHALAVDGGFTVQLNGQIDHGFH